MRTALVVWMVVGCVVAPRTASGSEVAVVVSQDNAVSNISFHELVKIFKQDKQFWDGGERIYLILRASGGPERALVLEKVYRMEDEVLKRFWVGKLYRGEITAFPKTLGSNEAVVRFVSQAPNAIGFVDAGAVDGRVKVLQIDGKSPGQTGYVLSNGL